MCTRAHREREIETHTVAKLKKQAPLGTSQGLGCQALFSRAYRGHIWRPCHCGASFLSFGTSSATGVRDPPAATGFARGKGGGGRGGESERERGGRRDMHDKCHTAESVRTLSPSPAPPRAHPTDPPTYPHPGARNACTHLGARARDTHAHTQTHAHTHTHMHMPTHKMQMHARTRTRARTHTHARTHARTHTHTHTTCARTVEGRRRALSLFGVEAAGLVAFG